MLRAKWYVIGQMSITRAKLARWHCFWLKCLSIKLNNLIVTMSTPSHLPLPWGARTSQSKGKRTARGGEGDVRALGAAHLQAEEGDEKRQKFHGWLCARLFFEVPPGLGHFGGFPPTSTALPLLCHFGGGAGSPYLDTHPTRPCCLWRHCGWTKSCTP